MTGLLISRSNTGEKVWRFYQRVMVFSPSFFPSILSMETSLAHIFRFIEDIGWAKPPCYELGLLKKNSCDDVKMSQVLIARWLYK
jgi:hypothetical protein